MADILNSEVAFLKSAFSYDNPFITTDEVIEWIKKQNDKITVLIKKIPFSELRMWHFDSDITRLQHDTGKFFSIDGLRINTNWGEVPTWDQPIINQPEIGYLGFITKEFNGVLHFLLQAKIEPGNINYVQLSPTLQATKSNYTQAHKGKSPAYLEYFINAKSHQTLLDQLQSEQGARFLRKRNRNIIIKIDDDIPLLENFIWLTLAQIKELMTIDNLVNMDTRTVISGIPYGTYSGLQIDLFSFLDNHHLINSFEAKVLKSMLSSEHAINSFDNIINFVTRHKCFFELNVQKILLSQIKNWVINEESIEHIEKKYFKIIAVEVTIANREVNSWTQPMVEPAQEGICAFICKEINGILHFAVQAKLECGNFDIIEFAPTVQCLTGNYKNSNSSNIPFLEYVLQADKSKIIFDNLQSEEGGRFYKEQNRNMLVWAGDEVSDKLPDNFIWMTLNQLQTFIRYNNYINIQARSLLAALNFKKSIKHG
jgi:oxidase EvaA